MDSELDPFDDIFSDNAAKNGRPTGKFRPKAKPKPRKESSASAQPTQCTPPISVSERESINASENCVDGTVIVPPTDDNRSSKLANLTAAHLADKEFNGSASGSHVETISSDVNAVCNPPFGESQGEKGDKGSLMQISDGLPSQTTTAMETQCTRADTSREEEIIIGTARNSCVDRGLRPCNTSGSSLAPDFPAFLDPSSGDKNKNFEFEERSTSPCLDTLDITTEFASTFGLHTGKLQPKPKRQLYEETHSATVPNLDDFESVPYQNDNLGESFLLTNPSDDIIDFSAVEFDHSIPTDPTIQIPSYNEAESLAKTSHLNDQHTAPNSTDRGRGTIGMGLEQSVNQQLPTASGQEDQHGRSSKRSKKQIHVHEAVDEPNEEDLETSQFRDECPKESAGNEDDHSDKEYQLEDELRVKKVRRKSKKPSAENGKPVRKRKKVNEVSDQSTKQSTKKFSNSTRKRGRFDKDWLKLPRDEIEISDLSLKDLILLGEYTELIAKKDPEASQMAVNNQSAARSSPRYFEDDDVFASEQEREFENEQERPAVEDTGTYFNYQSHMKKTPRGRWTKQDTELFYQALQQFGTDLTMITQLFPGRTRNQIKLKYKKEERQHPMKLHDALSSRSNDHSHYKLIVEQVKKAAAERKRNSEIDDLDGLSGEDPEGVPPEAEADEATKSEQEATKSEKVEQSEVENMEDDVPATTGPVESSDSEDDEKRWSQFRSDF